MSGLCPRFDEKKAKSNGHICILVRNGVGFVFLLHIDYIYLPWPESAKEHRGDTRLVSNALSAYSCHPPVSCFPRLVATTNKLPFAAASASDRSTSFACSAASGRRRSGRPRTSGREIESFGPSGARSPPAETWRKLLRGGRG